jgi:outer membrane lipoprotein LolB
MGLQYWIQSTSSPVTASAVDIDIDGRIAAIRQDGWEINYLSYFPMSQIQTQTAQALTARPQLMILKRMNLQIKLVIDHWNTE